jgi:MYXO-CTERM domain-containing protein
VAHRRVGLDARDSLIELTERLVAEVPLDVGRTAELVLAKLEGRAELVAPVALLGVDRTARVRRIDPVIEVRVVDRAGNLSEPVLVSASGDEVGCSCSAAGAPSTAYGWWLPFAASMLLVRRRSRA